MQKQLRGGWIISWAPYTSIGHTKNFNRPTVVLEKSERLVFLENISSSYRRQCSQMFKFWDSHFSLIIQSLNEYFKSEAIQIRNVFIHSLAFSLLKNARRTNQPWVFHKNFYGVCDVLVLFHCIMLPLQKSRFSHTCGRNICDFEKRRGSFRRQGGRRISRNSGISEENYWFPFHCIQKKKTNYS